MYRKNTANQHLGFRIINASTGGSCLSTTSVAVDTSSNNGVRPSCTTGASVVLHVTAGTPTVRMLGTSVLSTLKANRLAELPLFTMTACLAPTVAANSCSNNSVNLPIVSMPVRTHSSSAMSAGSIGEPGIN